MGLSLIGPFCSSFKTVPERIVLDIDNTDDAVHGGQQFTPVLVIALTAEERPRTGVLALVSFPGNEA